MDDFEINSTRDEIEILKESVVWTDICNDLNRWKDGFEKEISSTISEASNNKTASLTHVLTHLGELRGRIASIEYVLGILDHLLRILEDMKNDSERDSSE